MGEFKKEFDICRNVHHKYYIKELFAWEYSSDALVTLCQACHENLHKNKKIPVYDNKFKLVDHYQYCERCQGAGFSPEYSHIQSGICFRCNGVRYEELITE